MRSFCRRDKAEVWSSQTVLVRIRADFHTQSPLITRSNLSGDPRSLQDFNLLWIQEFKKTNAYEVWERVTDPMLFDIVEAR